MLCVVVYAYKLSMWGWGETRRLQVLGQPGLYREIPTSKNETCMIAAQCSEELFAVTDISLSWSDCFYGDEKKGQSGALLHADHSVQEATGLCPLGKHNFSRKVWQSMALLMPQGHTMVLR